MDAYTLQKTVVELQEEATINAETRREVRRLSGMIEQLFEHAGITYDQRDTREQHERAQREESERQERLREINEQLAAEQAKRDEEDLKRREVSPEMHQKIQREREHAEAERQRIERGQQDFATKQAVHRAAREFDLIGQYIPSNQVAICERSIDAADRYIALEDAQGATLTLAHELKRSATAKLAELKPAAGGRPGPG